MGTPESNRDRPYLLSKAELEVLTLLATGLSCRRAALFLKLSEKEIQERLTAIRTKMCVASNTEAAVKAIREHILPPELHLNAPPQAL